MPNTSTSLESRSVHQKFNRALEEMSQAADSLLRLRILYDLYQIEVDFAAQTKTAINYLPPEEVKNLFAFTAKLEKAMEAVKRGNLSVQEGKNGDIDIVAPSWMTKEQIAGLLGWIIPVVVGLVILVAVIDQWRRARREADKLATKYNAIVKATDATFCENPDSQKCQAWGEMKVKNEFEQRKTFSDKIGDFIGKAGTAVKKGGAIGIALAIPLLIWAFMPKKKNEQT
jgi:hypothetical protein